jgi:hypothetical protein
MRLGTLLALGALVFGGLYVARHVDDWKHRLHQEKKHLTEQLKNGLESEKEHVTEAVKERLAKERARAATALRKRLARERARTEAARRAVAKRRSAALRGLQDSTDGLNEAAFWRLVSETRSAAGNDTGKQSELLEDRLTRLSPQAILQFAGIRDRLEEQAYTWNLWAAASVIEGGCSADCFRDFRGYVISLGQDAYENALANPDSLASVAEDAETGDWENADDMAPKAYSRVTGRNFPLDDSDLSGQPSGTPLDQNDPAALASLYPGLAMRFR